jgi:hypothetical protein
VGQEIRYRDTVGQSVMHLGDNGDAVVDHPFDEVHLPQWSGVVQRCTCDLADQIVEFSPATRLGQHCPSQVVIDVDVAVLQPHGMVDLERDVNQSIAQRIQRRQPVGDDAAERIERELLTQR